MAIYVIRAGDEVWAPVKIGFTDKDSLSNRIQTLQTGSAYKLKDICLISEDDATQRFEKLVHKFLAPLRLEGEWFSSHECGFYQTPRGEKSPLNISAWCRQLQSVEFRRLLVTLGQLSPEQLHKGLCVFLDCNGPLDLIYYLYWTTPREHNDLTTTAKQSTLLFDAICSSGMRQIKKPDFRESPASDTGMPKR